MGGIRVVVLALALLHVSVAQEPSLQVLPSTIMKPLQEMAYASCMAVVDNPELVTEMRWSGPNGREVPNSEGTIIAMEGIDGPGKLDLLIQSLREEDTGEYECTAIYAGNQKLTAKLVVDSFMDIDFGDTPTLQTPIINTESKIRCNPKSKPAPQVDWLKDLVPLKNDDNHIIQQDGVLIKDVNIEDEGVYRCRARVPELGSIDYRDIQVVVHIPPAIDKFPIDVKGVEKATVTFECGATGKPAPTYSWVNKDNTPLEGVEGYYVDPDKGILTIMDLRPDHSGNYRCTAQNPAGDDTAEATLQVLTKPKVEQFLNVTMDVQKDLEMRCIATGDPLPEIVYQKFSNDHPFVNGINDDDRIEVQQTEDDEGRRVGILKIRDVLRADDGLYTCTATSEGGDTQVWGHITVEFPPTFESQVRNEEWSWQQRPVNLTCTPTAIPNATIEWYLRNKEIDANDPNLKVMSISPVGILQVNPVTSQYYGDYTCQATNRLGTENWDIELKEAHVPGPVASVKVEKKTATTITWSIIGPVDDGGLPVQGYRVEYRLEELPWDNSEAQYWTKDQTYTLDGLQPQATYVFRFAARSEAGEGEWSGEKVEEMPNRSAPEEPLIFGFVDDVSSNPYPNKINLQWQTPLDNGEPIDYYQIIYFEVRNVSGHWEDSGSKNVEKVDPKNTQFMITEVQSNTFYKIELRAHNEIGFSTPAERVIKTAEGTQLPEASTAQPGVGLIAGIVVIAVLVIVVIVDVTCYCTNNAGLTAAVLGKRGVKDKDKEAMLEDGKNTRKGPNRKSVMQNEDVRTVSNQEYPVQNEQINQNNPASINLHFMGPNKGYEKNRVQNVHSQQKPHIKKIISKKNTMEQNGYGPSGRPHSMAMALENPVFNTGNTIKASSSTPILDLETSGDSLYAVPTWSQQTPQSFQSPHNVRPKPALPVRNPNTGLTLGKQSQSHELLLESFGDASTDTINYGDHPVYNKGPRPPYNRSASREALAEVPRPPYNRYPSREAMNQASMPPYNRSASREPLIQAPRHPYNRSGSREVLNQAPRPPYNMSASREALNQAPRPPYNMSGSREALNQAPRPPYNMSASREALNQAPRPPYNMSASREALNYGHSEIYETIRTPSTTHSETSSSMYQSMSDPHYDSKPKTAYEIAPYDDPLPVKTTQRPTEDQQRNMSRLPSNRSNISGPTNVVQKPFIPSARPSAPPPVPPSSQNKEDKKPLKTEATLYLRDRPQQAIHSQSMDNLDDSHFSSQLTSRTATSYSPQSMTSARSLGSLLSTDSSQRSYGQPTFI